MFGGPLFFGLAFMAALFMFIFLGAIALYVLESLGYYTLAKKRGLDEAWLAWIPVVNGYLLGELTGDEMWGMKGSKYVLSITPFVLFLLNITGIGMILGVPMMITYLVYYYMCLYRLYKLYKPDSADLYLVTSILFNFMDSIWIFVIRNNEPDLKALAGKPSPQEKMYQEAYKEIPEEKTGEALQAEPYQPYSSVREALDNLDYESTPSIETVYEMPNTQDASISSLSDEEAAEIDERINSLKDSLDMYLNNNEYTSPFSSPVEVQEEEVIQEEKPNIELVFGDTKITSESTDDK